MFGYLFGMLNIGLEYNCYICDVYVGICLVCIHIMYMFGICWVCILIASNLHTYVHICIILHTFANFCIFYQMFTYFCILFGHVRKYLFVVYGCIYGCIWFNMLEYGSSWLHMFLYEYICLHILFHWSLLIVAYD